MSSWACSDHSGRLCGFRCRVQPEFSVRQCEFLRCEFPAGLRWLRRADTESQGNVSVQRASRRYRERGESRCFCDLRHRLDARAYDRDACAHGGADLRHRGSAHDHHLWRQVRHHAGGDARAPPHPAGGRSGGRPAARAGRCGTPGLEMRGHVHQGPERDRQLGGGEARRRLQLRRRVSRGRPGHRGPSRISGLVSLGNGGPQGCSRSHQVGRLVSEHVRQAPPRRQPRVSDRRHPWPG
mmetsp:Transcript_45928/g.123857  ORF Transcript_45928/g.123857 Transcript_45928/m.123857 type:complete len:239 (+) Transcript_45928:231-947(+)